MAISSITDEKLKEANKVVVNNNTVPSGYITIELSTKGKVGAPAVFHVRNFTTEDLMDLALTDENEIPFQVIKKLQDIIWEKDCDVKQFHEKEVIETLFILYKTFYSTTLPDVNWELTEDDKKFLAANYGGENTIKYKERINAYNNGKWVEKWSIDLEKIKTYDIPDDFKTRVHVVKKQTQFTYDYGIPRYGDVLILHDFIDVLYKEQDKRWAAIKEQVTKKNQLDNAFKNGSSEIDGSRIFIPENELKEYKAYEKDKALFATKCLKALHLLSVNGKDVTNLTLQERLKIIENPEFDHATFRQATELLNNLKFGLIEDIDGFDPILRKKVKVHYSFRILTLLQAIRDNDSDQSIITFE